MKAREVWRFRVNGNFLGSFLQAVSGTLVMMFSDRDHWSTLAGVSADGVGLWEKRWEGFAHFFCSRGRVFVDGDKARRIEPATGETQLERDLGAYVYVKWALDAGPIYSVAGGKRHFGLDGDALSTLWEWEDEDEDFTFDEGRLCRQNAGRGITVHELPSLRQCGPTRRTPLPGSGAHAHVGDLFCIFGYGQGGGRACVNLETGDVEWHYSEPSGYGLTVFDADRAYCPGDGLAVYDLRTGRQLWNRTFGDFPTSRAFVKGGRVYIATGDRFVHMLEALTGNVLLSQQLKFKVSGTVEPSPAIPWGDNRIVVGTRKEIICLEID